VNNSFEKYLKKEDLSIEEEEDISSLEISMLSREILQ
jgi:hypothetical protein